MIKKFRARRRLIKGILSLVKDSRVAEREIDKQYNKVLTESRINSVESEQRTMTDARDFISELTATQDRLERVTLGNPPWEHPRYSKEAEYWDDKRPRRLELDLKLGKWIWVRQSRRWLQKQERKRFKRPICRKQSNGSLTRLERTWLSYRQQQQAMLDNIQYLPYSFPLLDAIKVIQAAEPDKSYNRVAGHYNTSEERNRKIQQARIELMMAEEHIVLFSNDVLPMCLEGTDITIGWKERARTGRHMALSPQWDEYVAHCRLLTDDVSKAFQHRTALHGAEANLIKAVEVLKVLKKRHGKHFQAPKEELKHIDVLLSEQAPAVWLANDWDGLAAITQAQAVKLAEFSEALRAWLRVNKIPIDDELALVLEPLPTLEPIERTRVAMEGYVEAGDMGTQLDPSLREAWERKDV